MERMIRVWRFEDAPECYQRLSPHGGDEDWIAVVPECIDRPIWTEEFSAFGVCSVSVHDLGAFVVYIGAHA